VESAKTTRVGRYSTAPIADEPDGVLVVDAGDDLAALVGALGGAAHSVARSGADALVLLLERDFALIVLGAIHDMDTSELATAIRRRARSRGTPILSLSEPRARRDLAEALPALVWTATPDGRLDYSNRRFSEYTGLEPEQARGSGWLRAVHDADATDARARWLDSIARGAPYAIECRLRRAEDGRFRYHLGRAIPERDAHGQVRGWFGTFTDVEDLKQVIRTKDEFMALASHELRTPLTALKLRLQSIQRMPALPGEVSAKLEGAMRQTGRLERLIDGLLDVSRATTGHLELDPEEFDLADMVREVAEPFRAEAERAGVAIELALEGDTHGSWDRLRLEQVLMNLLSNALRYRDRGPVRVRLRADSLRVELAVEGGSPISEASLERLFERFERLDSARSRGGLGVGLYLSRQIVHAHSGTIRAVSPPGAVPTLTVTLPKAAPAASS
jgi:PAS domain S-box-containing protein